MATSSSIKPRSSIAPPPTPSENGGDASLAAEVASLSARLFGPASRLSLRWVALAQLHEQTINANVMPPAMFEQLTSNIGSYGNLESVPLVGIRSGEARMEIISGHHRVRAALKAGITHGLVLCYADITESELRAKQLAHNSISGTSDPAIVRQIYERIDGLDLQMEAFIDPDTLAALPPPVSFAPIDVSPLANARTITLVFLPVLAQDFEEAITLLSPDTDTVYLASREAFDGFADAVQATRDGLKVYSKPSAIAAMARLAKQALADSGTDANNEVAG